MCRVKRCDNLSVPTPPGRHVAVEEANPEEPLAARGGDSREFPSRRLLTVSQGGEKKTHLFCVNDTFHKISKKFFCRKHLMLESLGITKTLQRHSSFNARDEHLLLGTLCPPGKSLRVVLPL